MLRLVDPGSPFLELSSLAAHEIYGPTRQGLLRGWVWAQAVDCVIVANDATVKGGSYHPITVKKHLRAHEMAQANNPPCIYLLDSGGLNLPRPDTVQTVPSSVVPRALPGWRPSVEPVLCCLFPREPTSCGRMITGFAS
uniref:methylcrotonoyl-CoA carboxylase n=1 Tax=Culex pipiens TaxID=7175 RepID=A0A8D8CSZ4_CULPI